MKKENKGFTLVELLVVIGILGILMGALIPAVTGAMLSAKTAACAADGRNLVMGIIAATTDRENAGLSSAWPKTESATDNQDSEDLIGQGGFSDTPKYFDALFDMKNYGSQDWDPSVDKGLFNKISGQGIPPHVNGTSLKAQNVKWAIAANVDNISGSMPVLITRNAPGQELGPAAQSYNGESKKFKLGKANGGYSDTPFGADAFVLVRKDGGAQTLKLSQSNYKAFFQQVSRVPTEGAVFQYLPTQAD